MDILEKLIVAVAAHEPGREVARVLLRGDAQPLQGLAILAFDRLLVSDQVMVPRRIGRRLFGFCRGLVRLVLQAQEPGEVGALLPERRGDFSVPKQASASKLNCCASRNFSSLTDGGA